MTSVSAPPDDLLYCYDLLVPTGARVRAWAESGDITVATMVSGRRAMVSASAGARGVVLGLPAGPVPEAETLTAWWTANPAMRPSHFDVLPDGEAVRLPAATPLPDVVRADPELGAVAAALWPTIAVVAETETPVSRLIAAATDMAQAAGFVPAHAVVSGVDASSASELPVVSPVVALATLAAERPENDLDVNDLLDGAAHYLGARSEATGPLAVLTLAGEPLIVQRPAAGGEVFLYGDAGNEVVTAHVPVAVAAEGADAVAAWHDAHPASAPVGYRVSTDLALELDLNVLARLDALPADVARAATPMIDGVTNLTWGALAESRTRRRIAALRASAVPARALAAHITQTGTVPAAILGSTDVLYAPLPISWRTPEQAADVTVLGVPPHGGLAHVLWCALPSGVPVAYVATEGEYIIVPGPISDGVPPEGTALRLRADGQAERLSSTDRTRVWSRAVALARVDVMAPRTRAVTPAAEAPAATAARSNAPAPVASPVAESPVGVSLLISASPASPAAAAPTTPAAGSDPLPPVGAAVPAPAAVHEFIPDLLASDAALITPAEAMASGGAALERPTAMGRDAAVDALLDGLSDELLGTSATAVDVDRGAQGETARGSATADTRMSQPDSHDGSSTDARTARPSDRAAAPVIDDGLPSYLHEEVPLDVYEDGMDHGDHGGDEPPMELEVDDEGEIIEAELPPAATVESLSVDGVPVRVALPGYRTPHTSVINLGNWAGRSPSGELWASELLLAVATSAELRSAGCLVPMGLLRQGLAMSATDKTRFHRALTEGFADRVNAVRVFLVDGRTYFAREVGEKIRLIGPKGLEMKGAKVQKVVAASYERPIKACFDETIDEAPKRVSAHEPPPMDAPPPMDDPSGGGETPARGKGGWKGGGGGGGWGKGGKGGGGGRKFGGRGS